MARTRMIKPGFFRSRSLARCSRSARLTFQGLWAEADCAGRGIADPRILKGSIWPLDDDITPEIVGDHLAELEREHILLYKSSGETYYAVRNWEKHQAASYRTGNPEHPEPPGLEPEEPEACTDHRAPCTENGALREGKGSKTNAHRLTPRERDSHFDAFWQAYPLKVGKKKALTAWRRALKDADAKAIIDGAERYEANCTARDLARQFIAHPTTWLNRGGWDDELIDPDATTETEAGYR